MKIIYKSENLYIEGIATSEEERREAVKQIKMTLMDLSQEEINKTIKKIKDKKNLQEPLPFTPAQAPRVQTPAESTQTAQITELASEGQKRYMDNLNLQYDPNITKIEAIRLINEWKINNGIPVKRM